jgi:NodT family efflux transporter outer membrane factor (OMF) lipoprotein
MRRSGPTFSACCTWPPVLVFLAAALGGCVVGPDASRPANSAEQADAFIEATEDQNGREAPMGPWWHEFDDEVTDRLVGLALEQNIDLKVAAQRVLEARALLAASWGQKLPQISVGAGVDKRKNSFVLPQIGRVAIRSTTYDAVVAASWQVDIFGKLERQRQASEADLSATQAEQEALLHTVIAEVVRLRARIAVLTRRLGIARANVESWHRSFDTIERRYRQGVASALEYHLAKENLANTRALVPQVEYQLKSAHQALDVLLGRRPGTGPLLEDTLSDLPPLEPPPVGLPAALLDRRPDLRAAEMRQAAATARVGVAVADLYPDLVLGASAGYASDKLSQLVRPETFVWGLLADTAWRVFSGGTLRAQAQAARARADAAALQYGQLVLDALREVEDALLREETARRSYEQIRIRVAEATAAERLARERYQRGVERLIVVLESERRRRIAQDEQILAQDIVWNARINLFLALGGSWAETEGEPGGESPATSTGDVAMPREPAAEIPNA